jgi:hypothetical protein
MPKGDGAAIDVDDFVAHAQGVHRGKSDRSESLIDFNKGEIFDCDAFLGARGTNGVGGLFV